MMKGNFAGKGKSKKDGDRAHGGGRESAAVPVPIDEAILRDYLTDALTPEESARVEKALRDSAELRPSSRKSARIAPTGSSTPSEPSGIDRA